MGAEEVKNTKKISIMLKTAWRPLSLKVRRKLLWETIL